MQLVLLTPPLTRGLLKRATQSGALAMGSNKITGLGIGTAPTDAVNKQQMDILFSAGAKFKPSVDVYNTNNTGDLDDGVDATITQPGAVVPYIIGGITLTVGATVLMNGAGFLGRNGPYTLTAVANGGDAVWTRRPDADGSPTTELQPGSIFYVLSGTDGDKQYVQTPPEPTAIGEVGLGGDATCRHLCVCGQTSRILLVGGCVFCCDAKNKTENTHEHKSPHNNTVVCTQCNIMHFEHNKCFCVFLNIQLL